MELDRNKTINLSPFQNEDLTRLNKAIILSKRCVPVQHAFSVGAMIYDANGRLISTGYSRELGHRSHAEEVALYRAAQSNHITREATLYSSLEPCGERASSDKTCTQRIIEAGIRRVVFAMQEPDLFIKPTGLERFKKHGIEVIQIPELAPFVRDINQHLFV